MYHAVLQAAVEFVKNGAKAPSATTAVAVADSDKKNTTITQTITNVNVTEYLNMS